MKEKDTKMKEMNTDNKMKEMLTNEMDESDLILEASQKILDILGDARYTDILETDILADVVGTVAYCIYDIDTLNCDNEMLLPFFSKCIESYNDTIDLMFECEDDEDE